MRTPKTFKYLRVDHKVCAACMIDKPINEFRLQWRTDDGYPKKEPHKDLCRICDRERMLKYINEHTDYVGTGETGDNEPQIIV